MYVLMVALFVYYVMIRAHDPLGSVCRAETFMIANIPPINSLKKKNLLIIIINTINQLGLSKYFYRIYKKEII